MGLEEQAAEIRKKIEKIKRVLTDGTAPMLAQRTAKQNQIATLGHNYWLFKLSYQLLG